MDGRCGCRNSGSNRRDNNNCENSNWGSNFSSRSFNEGFNRGFQEGFEVGRSSNLNDANDCRCPRCGKIRRNRCER